MLVAISSFCAVISSEMLPAVRQGCLSHHWQVRLAARDSELLELCEQGRSHITAPCTLFFLQVTVGITYRIT